MTVSDEKQPRKTCEIRVAQAESKHLDAIVSIHMLAFQGFFLESLGPRFLKELYSGFIADTSCVCLVAVDGENLVGFVAGTTQPEGFFRRLLRKRWYAFVFFGAASMAVHPIRVGKKFLSAVRYRGKKPAEMPNAALLSSVGVAPNQSGKGVGKMLISAFCEKARALGAAAVFLTTDRDRNDAVNRFYLSNGFVLHSSFLKDGNRWMNLFTRSLWNSQASDQ